MKILVTSGATREPIDGVRFISNISTGRTGALIADVFARQGHSVVYLHGVGTALPAATAEMVEFSSFLDLNDRIHSLLGSGAFDAVVHLAAVSDYSVRHIKMRNALFAPSEDVKLDSQYDVELALTRNFKIVERLKEYAAPRPLLVIAFKLTNTPDEGERMKAVRSLALYSRVDYVVHNDLRDISGEVHRARIFQREMLVADCTTKEELTRHLLTLLDAHHDTRS